MIKWLSVPLYDQCKPFVHQPEKLPFTMYPEILETEII